MCFGRPVTSALTPFLASSAANVRPMPMIAASRSVRFSCRAADDARVGVGFEIAKCEVLEFPFQLPDTEPVRERRVDLADLDREGAALRGRATSPPQAIELFGDPDSTSRTSDTTARSILRSASDWRSPGLRRAASPAAAKSGRAVSRPSRVCLGLPRASMQVLRVPTSTVAHERIKFCGRDQRARQSELLQGQGNRLAFGLWPRPARRRQRRDEVSRGGDDVRPIAAYLWIFLLCRNHLPSFRGCAEFRLPLSYARLRNSIIHGRHGWARATGLAAMNEPD